MAILCLIISAAGFLRSYYLAPWFGTKVLTPIIHVHGIVMTAWVLFFLLQTMLAQTGRVTAPNDDSITRKLLTSRRMP